MSQIKTYARIKPTRHPFEDVDIVNGDLLLRIPDAVQYYTSPSKGRDKVTHQFRFDQVFEQKTSQEEVFNNVAVDIVDAFLSGYNGTIFAYGQTGTGKTFTVEGGARRYSERGLASRAVSRIYESLERRTDEEISVHISFLEIYQEVGYDLLNPATRGNWFVTPFPKVTVMEGPAGSCLIRDLTSHLAASEDIAQNLLIQGQINRTVAETPVNQRSSRSHAVFTIALTTKKPDSDHVIKSKLHLVDLAGSERVAKTGVDGQQLSEAKSINLSLHHLESVILALQAVYTEDKQKSNRRGSAWGLKESQPDICPKHIPYRNSLLTMLLRDSIGGNCLTVMVATISLEWQNLGETISTCRFAQRVACISNSVRRNEEIDDKSLVRILRKKIAELETEIACLKLSQGKEEESLNNKLTDEDKLRCGQIIQDYITGRLRDPITAGITDPFKFRECLRVFKSIVKTKSTVDNENYQRTNYEQRPSSSPSRIPSSRAPLRNCYSADQEISIDINSDRCAKTRRNTLGSVDLKACENKPSVGLHRTNSEGTIHEYPDGGRVRKSRTCSSQIPHKSPYHSKVRVKTNQDCSDNRQLSPANNGKVQRLLLQARQLRDKDELYGEQLSDLRLYICHLKKTKAEEKIIAQECLIETSLQHEKEAVGRKLERIFQKLERFCFIEGSQPTSILHDRQTLEEQFGQHRKSDGSLNTRQVFEKLHDKAPTHKNSINLADNRKLDNDTEDREMATRKKLMHFKKLLQDSSMIDQSDIEFCGDDSSVLIKPDFLGSMCTPPHHTSTPSVPRGKAWEMDHAKISNSKKDFRRMKEIQAFKDGSNSSTNDKLPVEYSDLFTEVSIADHSANLKKNDCEPHSEPTCTWSQTIGKQNHNYSQLLTPSEYINKMNSKEVLNAHQMGLYSKNFESALKSMLEKDNAKLFSHQNYDKFARKYHKDRQSSSQSMRMKSAGNREKVSSEQAARRIDYSDGGHTLNFQEDSSPLCNQDFMSTQMSMLNLANLESSSPELHSVRATPDKQREQSFISKAKEQRNRIEKIRKAQCAAGVIQRAWRKFRLK